MAGQIELVAGRECGTCNACCTHLLIADEAMTKMPGTLCRNWSADCGCSIYDTRPGACRTYHCGWRCLAELAEPWRPDRSGILINFKSRSEDDSGEVAAHLILIGGEETAKSRHLAGLAASFVEGGTVTYLIVPGPEGDPGNQVVVNPLIAEAVAAQSVERVQKVLSDLYARLPQPLSEPPSPMRAAPRVAVTYGMAPLRRTSST